MSLPTKDGRVPLVGLDRELSAEALFRYQALQSSGPRLEALPMGRSGKRLDALLESEERSEGSEAASGDRSGCAGAAGSGGSNSDAGVSPEDGREAAEAADRARPLGQTVQGEGLLHGGRRAGIDPEA
jgi:hypothetical protein